MLYYLSALKERFFPTKKDASAPNAVTAADVFLTCSNQPEFYWNFAAAYLAVENHYGQNDCGFEIFLKLESFKYGNTAADSEAEKLKQFITDWENDRSTDKTRVYINNDMTLQDGIFRLALAVYHGIENINAVYTDTAGEQTFDCNILQKDVFSAEDIALIKSKNTQLVQKLNQPFACIIWPPAYPFYKDILKDFESFGRVTNVRKLHYKKRSFEKAVHRIYEVDNIAKWKINTKLKYFSKYERSFIVFDLLLNQPDFYIAPGGIVSRRCSDAKKTVRARHKDRIKDYIYDIILHTCDNFYQAQYMQDLFSKNTDCEYMTKNIANV